MKLFKKKKQEQLFEIFPITKTIQFKTGLDQLVIKRQIVDRMINEILLATNFDIVNKPDGTTLMVGRIDVCRKVVEENSNDGQKAN